MSSDPSNLWRVTLQRLQSHFSGEAGRGKRLGALLVVHGTPTPKFDVRRLVKAAGNLPRLGPNLEKEFRARRVMFSEQTDDQKSGRASTLWILGDPDALCRFIALAGDLGRALWRSDDEDRPLAFAWTRSLFRTAWQGISGSPLRAPKWTMRADVKLNVLDSQPPPDSRGALVYHSLHSGALPVTAASLPDLFAASVAALDVHLTQKPADTPPSLVVGGFAPKAPEPVAKSKAVVLFGPADRPVVNERSKDVLTQPQYDVILALIRAGDAGLTKDQLDRQSKHGDARKIMRRLADSDPGWKAVLLLPGKTGRRYRIS